MATQETLVVLESFIGRIDKDSEVWFRKGDLVRADNPAVKKWSKFFGPALFPHEPRVEQATAAPGEKRGK